MYSQTRMSPSGWDLRVIGEARSRQVQPQLPLVYHRYAKSVAIAFNSSPAIIRDPSGSRRRQRQSDLYRRFPAGRLEHLHLTVV